MVIEMVNADGVAINVDPATVEKVLEVEAAGRCHLVIGTLEVAVSGSAKAAAALIKKARGTPCPVRPIPHEDPPESEAEVPPMPKEAASEPWPGDQ